MKIFGSHPAFIARGGCAVGLFIVLTIAMLLDLASGNTEAVGPWLMILAISAVLTIGSYLWNSATENHVSYPSGPIDRKLEDCAHHLSGKLTREAGLRREREFAEALLEGARVLGNATLQHFYAGNATYQRALEELGERQLLRILGLETGLLLAKLETLDGFFESFKMSSKKLHKILAEIYGEDFKEATKKFTPLYDEKSLNFYVKQFMEITELHNPVVMLTVKSIKVDQFTNNEFINGLLSGIIGTFNKKNPNEAL
jgi:hypothetical protein